MDIVSGAIVAVVSAFAGYAIFLWRNRISPWFALTEISENLRANDQVEIPAALYQATSDSFLMEKLEQGTTTLESLSDALETAGLWIRMTDGDAALQIQQSLEAFHAAQTNDQMIEAIRKLLGPVSFSSMVQIGLTNQLLHAASVDPDRPVVLPFYESEDNGGSFMIELPTSVLRFGRDFKTQPFRRDRLRPFVEILSRLEKEKIEPVLLGARPLLEQQIEVQKKIRELGDPILAKHTRWQCEFVITNLGSAPFILFSEGALLKVRGKQIRDFDLPCHLIKTSSSKNSWEKVDGVLSVGAGETIEVSVTTKDTQAGTPDGATLRGCYQDRNATAQVTLRALSNTVPWKRTLKSTELTFG